MDGAAGRLSRIGGEWHIFPAYWQGPSFTFDANALTGDLQWDAYRSASDLVNRVNGTYIAPNYPYNPVGNAFDGNGYFYDGSGTQNNFGFAFQPTNFPQYACDKNHGYASDQYLTEDGGVFHPKQLTLSTVLSVAQAQRIAKINLLRNRQQGSGTFPMNLAAWQMQPCDVMQFTMPYLGWTEKTLEVTGVNFMIGDAGDGMQSVRCAMSVQETDASIYEWNPALEEQTIYAAPAGTTNPYAAPNPPTNMTLTSGAATALQTLDGVVHPRIEVQWDEPLDVLTTQIQVQYALTSAPTLWIDNGLVDVANTLTYISDVIAGQAYNVRVRGMRSSGVTSAWEEIDGYTVSITLSVVGLLALAPGSLIGEAFSDGTAEIIVSGFTATVGNASVAVLPGGAQATIVGLAQQQTYWVYYVDPNFTGGAITPIATQNSADFLNKPGYFLIDSITTPYAAGSGSGGTGGGGSTGQRYSPSTFTDSGSRTTSNPAYAYDGNSTTAAIVGANAVYIPGDGNGTGGNTEVAAPIGGGTYRTTFGSIMYEGFASYVTTATTTLTVLAAFTTSGGSANITASINGTSSVVASLTATTASTAYTLAVPVGTNLSTITVQLDATADAGEATTTSATLQAFELYVQ